MTTPRPAGRRFRAEAFPLALAALLAVSLPVEARGGHGGGGGRSGGGHGGGGRSAHATGSHGTSSPSRGSSTSTPRTAHPVTSTPGAERQPSFDRSHGGGHFHGGHRVFFNGGFFYDPFFYGAYAYSDEGRRHHRNDNGDDEEVVGNVELDVQPRDARVYVNDTLAAKSGRGTMMLPAGDYSIQIEREGYRSQTIHLDVQPGIRYRIERELQKIPEEKDNR